MIRLIKLLSILLVVFVWNSPMRADTNMQQGEDLLKPVPLRARSIKGVVITADLDSVTIDISSSAQGIGIGSLVKVFTSMSTNGLAAMAGFWEVEKIMGPYLFAVPLDMQVMPEAFGNAIVYPLESSELLTRVAPGYAKSGDRYYVDKKYDKAAKAYTLASKMGHANSMVRLGIMYAWGLHFPIDNERAVFWYEKAAILNHPSGIYHLGLMMSKGEGIKKDLPRARNLFAKSAAMDDLNSQFNLGVCYYNGLGGKKDYAKALEWFEKAAAHKIKEAFFAVGIMYEKGQGVDQDRIKAVSYYKRAADMGDARAEKKITALLNAMKAGPEDLEKTSIGPEPRKIRTGE